MVQIALDVQNGAPQDALAPPTVPSSYAEALDTVKIPRIEARLRYSYLDFA